MSGLIAAGAAAPGSTRRDGPRGGDGGRHGRVAALAGEPFCCRAHRHRDRRAGLHRRRGAVHAGGSRCRPHHALLNGVRDAVAPPGALAFASVRVATPTACVGVVIASAAATGAWWMPLGIGVPVVLAAGSRATPRSREAASMHPQHVLLRLITAGSSTGTDQQQGAGMTTLFGKDHPFPAARATSRWLVALLVAAGQTGCGNQSPSPATGLPAAETGSARSSPPPIDATTSPGQDSAGWLVVTAQGRIVRAGPVRHRRAAGRRRTS